MTDQYIRSCRLVIGQGGEAVDLSDFRIQFEVRNATTQTLKSAVIRIFNVSPQLATKARKEFTRVELSAGYGDSPGLIFSGEIYMVRYGRVNATDTILELDCQDGDHVYNWAVTNQTLAKGHTPQDIHKALLNDLAPYGIAAGYSPQFTTTPSVDAWPMFGQTREILRQFANDQKCYWNLEDGKLNFVAKRNGYIVSSIPSLDSSSGLIGIPVQTIGGINVRCLIKSAIKCGRIFKLDNEAISRFDIKKASPGNELPVPQMNNDGNYVAFQVKHTGDTRGDQWYTDIVAVSIDPKDGVPATQDFVNSVPSSD